MHIALVNTNRIRPPIAPIGLEYVAEALGHAGHDISVLDLCWEDHWEIAVSRFFNDIRPALIGVTLRNTDDCAFTTRQSFLSEFSDIIQTIRKQTESPIIIGGVGFSTMPEQVLALCNADGGIWGDGEFAFVELANRIERNENWHTLPNLIWKQDGKIHRNTIQLNPLENLPPMSRKWIDIKRYFKEGGQIGFETKRGCPMQCIYCADPVAKGNQIRVRPPKGVVDELENLLALGVDHLHTCDSEFNIPAWHAGEVCQKIINRGLGESIRWYAYCAPRPFSRELAQLMRKAGCVGINFGIDSGDEDMLKRLKRDFSGKDILNAARYCKEVGIVSMFDLLIGSPGESKESIIQTIELMKRANPDCVGIALGVRIYQGTEISEMVKEDSLENGLIGGGEFTEPLFFFRERDCFVCCRTVG
ncbi:radical SAM protein [bacterium]|nr:radical SAM protein [bacterium]